MIGPQIERLPVVQVVHYGRGYKPRQLQFSHDFSRPSISGVRKAPGMSPHVSTRRQPRQPRPRKVGWALTNAWLTRRLGDPNALRIRKTQMAFKADDVLGRG
jgi:hypothetical protein